jgi:hypothetical protein
MASSCDMCDEPGFGQLVVDHCLIRGRLCRSCNHIESFSRDPKWEHWRLEAPELSRRAFYDGHPGPARLYFTTEELMTLPMSVLLAVA